MSESRKKKTKSRKIFLIGDNISVTVTFFILHTTNNNTPCNMADEFCRKCGGKLKSLDQFCFKCGEKKHVAALVDNEDKSLSLDNFKKIKHEERSAHFKKPKTFSPAASSSFTFAAGSSSASGSRNKVKSNPLFKHMVTVNIGLMNRDNHFYLKPVRGKKLPVKVVSW